jgi:hypothetical protein
MRLFGHTGERLRPSAGSTRLWIVLVLFAAVGLTMTATASLTSPAHLVLVRLVGLAVLALAALAAQAAQTAMAAIAAPDGPAAVHRTAHPTELAEARADELQRVAVVIRAMPRPTDPTTLGALTRVEAAIRRLSTSWSFERPPLAEAVPGSLRTRSHPLRAERGPEIEPSERGAASLAPDPAPHSAVEQTILPIPAPVVASAHGRRWHRRRSAA